MSTVKHTLTLNPSDQISPLKEPPSVQPQYLPDPKHLHSHPSQPISGKEDAKLHFIGNATCVIEWNGIRIMTDPNFLHAGDHVHLGPGVTGTRQVNPAIDLHQLPPIDVVLLSHFHADHFDQLVEASLRRDLPIFSTPHAKKSLEQINPPFTNVLDLDHWELGMIRVTESTLGVIKVTAMPGKHVPPGPMNVIQSVNEFLGAVPPVNGWMVEFGLQEESRPYRLYISGDTLLIDDLKEIPKHFPQVDLMLVHLGGTTIPSPKIPLLMVTLDAAQGIKLIQLINPNVVIPIHFGADNEKGIPAEYDVFLSDLDDFKREIEKDGTLSSKVVYLDRGDAYEFSTTEK